MDKKPLYIYIFLNQMLDQVQWLMPGIQTGLEVEIRRVEVGGQSKQKS
jgi:hypothetical protein